MNEMDKKAPEKNGKTAFYVTLGLIVLVIPLAVLQRLGPKPFNVTMVGALALFAGARIRSWWAIGAPLAVMAITDLVLWQRWGYPPNPVVYGSFAVYFLLGRYLAQSKSAGRVVGACVLGSVQFFLATNFSVWYMSRMDAASLPAGTYYTVDAQDSPYVHPMIRYADNLGGLGACYGLGIAFSRGEAPPLGWFGNVLLGDLLFCGLLFVTHALLLCYFSPRPSREMVGGVAVEWRSVS